MTTMAIPLLDAYEERRWFVVYVEPSREQLSAKLLAENGYEVYLPTYQKRVERCAIWTTITLPLFSRYVFCRLTSTITHRVIGTPGVVRLIGFSEGSGAIDDREIQLLKKLVEMGASPFQDSLSQDLSAGSCVRIRSGPLTGMTGILVRTKETHRVVMTLELIQKSISIEIDYRDVEICAKHP